MKRLVLGMAAVAALMLALGAGFGGADPGANGAHGDGHGHWFRQVCDNGVGTTAGCDAQVETDSDGTPLAGGGPIGGYNPAQLTGAYGLPSAPIAGNAHPLVVIVDAYDDPNAASDLNKFSSQYGLPQCNAGNPCFTKLNQNGRTSSYPASNSGWDLEISLDIETAHGLCPECNIDLVEASSSSIANLGAAENEGASLHPAAMTNSWGASESSSETGWDASYFNHPGTAITASTGDDGYGVEWPASSPYVTAVGGTTLTVGAGNTYGGETAWVDGGSGCSSVESQPSWQSGLGSCQMRSVADVAADADPGTGEAVYDSVSYDGESGWFQVGGTSLSSPIIAAAYALADNTGAIDNGSTPYAYKGTSSLHDVTSGSNGSCSPNNYLCTAGVGYDGPTGVGTPDGVAAFSPTPPTPDFSLSAGTQSGTITAGTVGSATYTVNVHSLNGFGDAVALTTTGSLPSGVTSSFNPASTKTTSTLTLTATASAPAGTFPFQISGTADGLTRTVNASLTIASAPPPNFTVAITPSSQSVGTSGSVKYMVTIAAVNGFNNAVSFSVSGLPRNVSGAFSTNPINGGSGSSTLTVISKGAKHTNNASFTVMATGGGVTHTQTAKLTIST